MKHFLFALAAVTLGMSPAAAQTVERVAHGVVVTPKSGAAKRVRVLAYGDAQFRVTAVPDAGPTEPPLAMIRLSGAPLLAVAVRMLAVVVVLIVVSASAGATITNPIGVRQVAARSVRIIIVPGLNLAIGRSRRRL